MTDLLREIFGAGPGTLTASFAGALVRAVRRGVTTGQEICLRALFVASAQIMVGFLVAVYLGPLVAQYFEIVSPRGEAAVSFSSGYLATELLGLGEALFARWRKKLTSDDRDDSSGR